MFIILPKIINPWFYKSLFAEKLGLVGKLDRPWLLVMDIYAQYV